jgi:hypothetical protein
MSFKFITLPKSSRGFLNVGTGEGGGEVIIVRKLIGKITKKGIKGKLTATKILSGKITKKIIKGVMNV